MAKKSIAPSQNPRNDLTAKFVRSILRYDPETGFLYWKKRFDVPPEWNTRRAGCVAGTARRNGYSMVWILKISYSSHRIIWLMMTGAWPKKHIDHKNGIRDDNSWINLREATVIENGRNKKLYTGTSGYKGVSYYKAGNNWSAYINVKKKKIHIGYFDTAEEAHAAYCASAKKLFKNFARFK